MSRKILALVAAATAIVAPLPAWAFGGGPGCADLPELYRAYGALEGLSTCDMTLEQARRIVTQHDGSPALAQPMPRAHHRRHRVPFRQK